MQADKPVADLVAGMNKTLKLLVAHSRYEEELLEQRQYKYRDIHKDVHDRFNRGLTALIDRIERGSEEPAAFFEEMNKFLVVHVTTHDHGF